MRLKLTRTALKAFLLLLIYVTYVSARPSREDYSEEVDSEEDKDDDDNDNDSEDDDNSDSKQSHKPLLPTPVVTSDGGNPSHVANLKKIADYLEKFIQKYIKPTPNVLSSNGTESKKPVTATPALLQSLSTLLQAIKNSPKPGSAKPLTTLSQMPAFLEMLKPLVSLQQQANTTKSPTGSTTPTGIPSKNETEATTEPTTLLEVVGQNGTEVPTQSTSGQPNGTEVVIQPVATDNSTQASVVELSDNSTQASVVELSVNSTQASVVELSDNSTQVSAAEPSALGSLDPIFNNGSSPTVETGTLNEPNTTIQDPSVTESFDPIQDTLSSSGGIASQDIAVAEIPAIDQNSTGIDASLPVVTEATTQNIDLLAEFLAGLEQLNITSGSIATETTPISSVVDSPKPLLSLDAAAITTNNLTSSAGQTGDVLGSAIISPNETETTVNNPAYFETTTANYAAEIQSNDQNQTIVSLPASDQYENVSEIPSTQDQTSPPVKYPTTVENLPTPQDPIVFEASSSINNSIIVEAPVAIQHPQAFETPVIPQTPSFYETPTVSQLPSAIEIPVDTQYPSYAQSSQPSEYPTGVQFAEASNYPAIDGTSAATPTSDTSFFLQNPSAIEDPEPIAGFSDAVAFSTVEDQFGAAGSLPFQEPQTAGPIGEGNIIHAIDVSPDMHNAANELSILSNPTMFPVYDASTIPSEPLSIPDPIPAPPIQGQFNPTAEQPSQNIELASVYEQNSQYIEPSPYVPQSIFETQPQTLLESPATDPFTTQSSINAMQQAEADAIFASNAINAMEQAEAEAVFPTSSPFSAMEHAEAEAILASTNTNNAMEQAEAEAILATTDNSYVQPEELTEPAIQMGQYHNDDFTSIQYPAFSDPKEASPSEYAIFGNDPVDPLSNLAFPSENIGQAAEALGETIIPPPSQISGVPSMQPSPEISPGTYPEGTGYDTSSLASISETLAPQPLPESVSPVTYPEVGGYGASGQYPIQTGANTYASIPIETQAPSTVQQNAPGIYPIDTQQATTSQNANPPSLPSQTFNTQIFNQISDIPSPEMSSAATYSEVGGYDTSGLSPIQTGAAAYGSIPLDTQELPTIQQNLPEAYPANLLQQPSSQTFDPSVSSSQALTPPASIGLPIDGIHGAIVQSTEPQLESSPTLSPHGTSVPSSSYPALSNGLVQTSDFTSSGFDSPQAAVLNSATSSTPSGSYPLSSTLIQSSDTTAGSIPSLSTLGSATPPAASQATDELSYPSQPTGSWSYSPELSITQESTGITSPASIDSSSSGIMMSAGNFASLTSGQGGSRPSSVNPPQSSTSELAASQPSYGISGLTAPQPTATTTLDNTIALQSVDVPPTQSGSQPSYETNSGSTDPLTNVVSQAYSPTGTQPGLGLENNIPTGNIGTTSPGGLGSQPSYTTTTSSVDASGNIGILTLGANGQQPSNGMPPGSYIPVENIGVPSFTSVNAQYPYETTMSGTFPIEADSAGLPLGASNFENQPNVDLLSGAAGIALAEMALADAGLADPLPAVEVTSSPDILLPMDIMASNVVVTAPSIAPPDELPIFDPTFIMTVPGQVTPNIETPSKVEAVDPLTQTTSIIEIPLAESTLAQTGLAESLPNVPVQILPNVALPTEEMALETATTASDLVPPDQLPVFDPNNLEPVDAALTPLSGPAGIALAETALAAAGLADPLPIEEVTALPADPIIILPTEDMVPETVTTATMAPNLGPNEQLPIFDPTSIGALVQLAPMESIVEKPLGPAATSNPLEEFPINDPTIQDMLPIVMTDIDAMFNEQTTLETTTQVISTRPPPTEVILAEILPADAIPGISFGGGSPAVTASPSSIVSANQQQQSQVTPTTNKYPPYLQAPGPYAPPANQFSSNPYGQISNHPQPNETPVFNYNQGTPSGSYAPSNDYGGYPRPIATPQQPVNIPLGNYQTILDEGALVGSIIGPDGDEHFPPPMIVEADYTDPAELEHIIATEYLKERKPNKGARRKTQKKGTKHTVDKVKTAEEIKVKKSEGTEPAAKKRETTEGEVLKSIANNEMIRLESDIPATELGSHVARQKPEILSCNNCTIKIVCTDYVKVRPEISLSDPSLFPMKTPTPGLEITEPVNIAETLPKPYPNQKGPSYVLEMSNVEASIIGSEMKLGLQTETKIRKATPEEIRLAQHLESRLSRDKTNVRADFPFIVDETLPIEIPQGSPHLLSIDPHVMGKRFK